MAANAYRESASGDIPLDQVLDLLVDGELPEEQRRALLLAIERQKEPDGSWRTVALRFLQRQTEQQAVRRLMAGGNVVPVEFVPRLAARRHILGRIRPLPLIMAAAAGLLIVATSALVALHELRPSRKAPVSPAVAEIKATIPGDVISSSEGLAITLPKVRARDDSVVFPVSDESDTGLIRKSVIIQSDGRDGFIMIPVSTFKTKVY